MIRRSHVARGRLSINRKLTAADSIGPRPAHETLDTYAEKLALRSVLKSLENLMTFPCVRILAGRGKIQLHGAYFEVMTGVLRILDPATGRFEPVTDDPLGRISLMGCTEA